MKKTTFRAHLNRDTIAKLFFDAAEERYPGSEKILQMASAIVDPISLDPLENVNVKIVLLNAIRDMIREVSPTHLFRSIQHRDDLFTAVIEALENLEDRLEDLEEAQEGDQIEKGE